MSATIFYTPSGSLAQTGTNATVLTKVALLSGSVGVNTSSITSLQLSRTLNEAALQSEVTRAVSSEGTLGTSITSNTGAIASTASKLTADEVIIAASSASITGIQAKQVTDEGLITVNTAGIASNLSTIAAHTTLLSTHTTKLATIQSTQTTDEGLIAANTSSIATNTAGVATNVTAIAATNEQVAANITLLSTHSTKIATIQSSQTADETAIATNTVNIAANKFLLDTVASKQAIDEAIGLALLTSLSTNNIDSTGNSLTIGGSASTTSVNIGTSSAVQTLSIGTGSAAKTIIIGGPQDTIQMTGSTVSTTTTNLAVSDNQIVLNKGGLSGSSGNCGLQLEESGAVAAYIQQNTTRDGFALKSATGPLIVLNQDLSKTSNPQFQSVTAQLLGTASNATYAVNSGTAVNFSGDLFGDIVGKQGVTVVSAVGGVSFNMISSQSAIIANATATAAGSKLVIRDGSGGAAFSTVTAAVVGNASSATLAANTTNVGSQLATAVNTAVTTVQGATSSATASTLAMRDSSSNISSSTFTGALVGNSSSATTFTNSLVGDVTGGIGSTVVATVGGSSAALIRSAEQRANAATTANTVSTIVMRDASSIINCYTTTGDIVKTSAVSLMTTNDSSGCSQVLVTNNSGQGCSGLAIINQMSPNVCDLSFRTSSTTNRAGIRKEGRISSVQNASNVAEIQFSTNGVSTFGTVDSWVGTAQSGFNVPTIVKSTLGVTGLLSSAAITASGMVNTTAKFQQNGSTILDGSIQSSLNVGVASGTASQGAWNVSVGTSCMNAMGSGCTYNTGVGAGVMHSMSNGAYNTAVGYNSGYNLTTGQRCLSIGSYTGYNNMIGSDITLLGHGSNTSVDNLQNAMAIGANATVSASNTIQLGNSTTNFINTSAAIVCNQVNVNTSVTAQSVLATVGAYSQFGAVVLDTKNLANSIYIAGAGGASVTGTQNVGICSNALLKLTTGAQCIAIGMGSLGNATTTVRCTAIGAQSQGVLVSGSGNNISVGHGSLGSLSSGAGNIALGVSGASGLVSGSNNVMIGDQTISNDSGYQAPCQNSNNIVLGAAASPLQSWANDSAATYTPASGGQLVLGSTAFPLIRASAASAGSGANTAGVPAICHSYLCVVVSGQAFRIPLYLP